MMRIGPRKHHFGQHLVDLLRLLRSHSIFSYIGTQKPMTWLTGAISELT